MTGNNIIPQNLTISKKDRNRLLNNKSFVIWFTGLSGSGKSTLANETEKLLNEKGYLTYVLDGDNIRGGLNKDLAFSEEDRKENIRRIGEVAKLMIDAGIIVLTASERLKRTEVRFTVSIMRLTVRSILKNHLPNPATVLLQISDYRWTAAAMRIHSRSLCSTQVSHTIILIKRVLLILMIRHQQRS